jgi:hypothetical protein
MRRWLAVSLGGGIILAIALVVLALLDVAPALPLVTFVVGVLSTFVTGLVLCLLLLFRLVHLRHRPVSARPLIVPALVIGAGILGLLAGYLAGPAPVPDANRVAADQLAYLYGTDQRDRVTLRFLNTSRDDARIARVLELHQAESDWTPEEMLDAAMVLQHGHDSSHYRIAHELAAGANERGVNTQRWPKGTADWLMKATYDRWMMSIGKPQVYGTQMEFITHF